MDEPIITVVAPAEALRMATYRGCDARNYMHKTHQFHDDATTAEFGTRCIHCDRTLQAILGPRFEVYR